MGGGEEGTDHPLFTKFLLLGVNRLTAKAVPTSVGLREVKGGLGDRDHFCTKNFLGS